MKKHQKQIDAFLDPSRFKFLLAGRRGGKTFLMTEDIVKTIYNAKPKQEICYVAPSHAHAKSLIWEPLLDRMHQLNWKVRPQISKSRIELLNGRKIYILGAEKISRIRGKRFIKAYLDEVAYFTHPLTEIWRALRPTLADFKGGCIMATTPNGKGTDAYDFYLNIQIQDSWKYFKWKTIDNPYISESEIEAAKREMDEKSYMQEFEAEWQSFEGLAYYSFDEAIHVKSQPPIDPSSPVHLCFDFNVNPTSLLLSQKDGDLLRYKKEYSLKNSSTEETVIRFCEDHKNQNLHLKIRGDASGSARKSNTGKSDYHYVKEILLTYGFRFDHEVLPANPAIVDRLKICNSWLKPFVGSHKVEIDPSCRELVRDLSSQELDGRIPSVKNNLGHKADAFGYDIYWQHIIENRNAQKTITF